MPKDYAHRTKKTTSQKHWRKSPPSSTRKKFPWKALLLLIVIVSALTFALFSLKNQEKEKTPILTNLVKKTITPPKKLVKQKPKQPDIHFDFYTILPKTTSEPPGKKQNLPIQQKVHKNYVVQVASLSNAKEAKILQKELKHLGFNSKISVIKRGKLKWNRIQIGPFSERQSAQKIYDQLQKEDISSLIISL